MDLSVNSFLIVFVFNVIAIQLWLLMLFLLLALLLCLMLLLMLLLLLLILFLLFLYMLLFLLILLRLFLLLLLHDEQKLVVEYFFAWSITVKSCWASNILLNTSCACLNLLNFVGWDGSSSSCSEVGIFEDGETAYRSRSIVNPRNQAWQESTNSVCCCVTPHCKIWKIQAPKPYLKIRQICYLIVVDIDDLQYYYSSTFWGLPCFFMVISFLKKAYSTILIVLFKAYWVRYKKRFFRMHS